MSPFGEDFLLLNAPSHYLPPVIGFQEMHQEMFTHMSSFILENVCLKPLPPFQLVCWD